MALYDRFRGYDDDGAEGVANIAGGRQFRSRNPSKNSRTSGGGHD